MVLTFVKFTRPCTFRLLTQNYLINQIHHNLVLSLKTTKKVELSSKNSKIVCRVCNFTNIADQEKQLDLICFHDHDENCAKRGI